MYFYYTGLLIISYGWDHVTSRCKAVGITNLLASGQLMGKKGDMGVR